MVKSINLKISLVDHGQKLILNLGIPLKGGEGCGSGGDARGGAKAKEFSFIFRILT